MGLTAGRETGSGEDREDCSLLLIVVHQDRPGWRGLPPMSDGFHVGRLRECESLVYLEEVQGNRAIDFIKIKYFILHI